MTQILIGSTSWTEKSLVESGRFYPPEVKSAEERLRYYAEQFPIVEVDSAYYGLPSEHNSALWAERTPAEFVFDIKAFRLFTHHQTPPEALPRDVREALGAGKRNLYYENLSTELIDELWARFASALEPLRAAGKLGVVLFQFPPWFASRPSHFDYLLELKQRLPRDRIAVEFRNRSWFEGRHWRQTLAFEREHDLVHVVVDEPQGCSGSIPCVWGVTSSEMAVVRLHGRNRATWQKKDLESASQRFDYLYSPAELTEFIAPVRRMAEDAREVHVLFNNCHRDHSVRNAADFLEMLHR